jgi:predicted nuclease of predicted toxin-antitoxin system
MQFGKLNLHLLKDDRSRYEQFMMFKLNQGGTVNLPKYFSKLKRSSSLSGLTLRIRDKLKQKIATPDDRWTKFIAKFFNNTYIENFVIYNRDLDWQRMAASQQNRKQYISEHIQNICARNYDHPLSKLFDQFEKYFNDQYKITGNKIHS